MGVCLLNAESYEFDTKLWQTSRTVRQIRNYEEDELLKYLDQ
jgi:hypothetical protein